MNMKIFSILCVITTIAKKTSTLFDHENLVFISKNKRERVWGYDRGFNCC